MITTDKTKIFMENVDILCSMNDYNVINIEKMLGLSAGYISRCRSGQRHMSLDVACEIADILEQPIDVMIDDTLPIKTQIDFAQKEITRLKCTVRKLENQLHDKEVNKK